MEKFLIDPKKISVVEVGPRDGFQNIKEYIPLDVKYETISLMAASGVTDMEITSFVSPKAIPQMADASHLARKVVGDALLDKIRFIALVPNAKGAAMARDCGISTVSYVISVSERHNMENVRRSPDQSLEELANLTARFPDMTVRLDVATAFGCPFLGRIPEDAVMRLVDRGLEAGAKEIILCDTIGAGNPVLVDILARRYFAEGRDAPLGLHLHDTRGMGLANALAGLLAGVTMFETSVAGLGGCPFAPGATGNTSTEDMVNMFIEMGMDTGIDLPRYMKAVRLVRERIQPHSTSRLANLPVTPKGTSACGSHV